MTPDDVYRMRDERNRLKAELERQKERAEKLEKKLEKALADSIDLAAQNQCQRENYAFAHAKAEELREALRKVREALSEDDTFYGAVLRVEITKALGEEAQS